ncbi:hypothetical protein T10_3363 [Trichinella papuae]|uniref:Uncharacterized protein n=1 Tax=Trichinella papuae TaxID=268474 RepID=A0A0V1N8E0_9BILA|nr:hypothetical protein T10_3363 [Trichinella papuae]
MNGEGKNADVKLEKQMCAEVNGKPYCAFIHLFELIHNDYLSRPKGFVTSFPHPQACNYFQSSFTNSFNSMNVNEDLVRKKQIASKYPKQVTITTTTTTTTDTSGKVYISTVFAIYLKCVTKNDKVYNFKQHYVTCIAMFVFVSIN